MEHSRSGVENPLGGDDHQWLPESRLSSFGCSEIEIDNVTPGSAASPSVSDAVSGVAGCPPIWSCRSRRMASATVSPDGGAERFGELFDLVVRVGIYTDTRSSHATTSAGMHATRKGATVSFWRFGARHWLGPLQAA